MKNVFALLALILAYFIPVASASTPLPEILSNEKKLDQETAKKTIDEVFDCIKNSLAKGESVQIRNFGTFYLQKRQARKGINPKTKAPIDIPARSYARFRASENLKEKIFSAGAPMETAKSNVEAAIKPAQ